MLVSAALVCCFAIPLGSLAGTVPCKSASRQVAAARPKAEGDHPSLARSREASAPSDGSPKLAIPVCSTLVGDHPLTEHTRAVRSPSSRIGSYSAPDSPGQASPPLSSFDRDLPSAGRSLFDRVVADMGGVRFPFERVIDHLDSQPGIEVVRAQFPHGRSLQRHLTDFDAPRDLITIRPRDPRRPITSPRQLLGFPSSGVFIAYSPRANTLEVISFNPSLGRYEFQLVEDYGPNMTPKVRYAPRQFCLSCHQNRGPIFPLGPWQESSNPFANEERLKQGAYWKDPSHRIERFPRSNSQHFESAVPAFDAIATGVAEEIGANFHTLWTRACPPGPDQVEYRRRMLDFLFDAAVNRRLGPSPAQAANAARLDQLLAKSWPEEGLPQQRVHLNDRHLEDYPPNSALPPGLDPIAVREPRLATYHLGEIANYSTVIGTHEARYLLEVAGGDPKRLSAALASRRVRPILQDEVFARPALFRALLEELGLDTSKIPDVTHEGIAGLPKPVLASSGAVAPLDPAYPVPAAKLLRKNCAPCHASNASRNPFYFLSGTSKESAERFRVMSASILKRLEASDDHVLMPPPASDAGQRFRGSPDQRRQMIEAIKEWAQSAR